MHIGRDMAKELSQLQFLSEVDEESLIPLLTVFQEETLSPGHMVCQLGCPVCEFVFVIHGTVRRKAREIVMRNCYLHTRR